MAVSRSPSNSALSPELTRTMGTGVGVGGTAGVAVGGTPPGVPGEAAPGEAVLEGDLGIRLQPAIAIASRSDSTRLPSGWDLKAELAKAEDWAFLAAWREPQIGRGERGLLLMAVFY